METSCLLCPPANIPIPMEGLWLWLKDLKTPYPKGGQAMGRTIKTRHVQKDIKVLDKTVTAAEHMKGAYIRTRDSAEQTQVKDREIP